MLYKKKRGEAEQAESEQVLGNCRRTLSHAILSCSVLSHGVLSETGDILMANIRRSYEVRDTMPYYAVSADRFLYYRNSKIVTGFFKQDQAVDQSNAV